jgi:AraC-like DNA-binding protein
MDEQVTFYHAPDDLVEIIVSRGMTARYPTHTHINRYTLGLVLSGGVRITVREAEQRCGEGEFFVIPPDTPHALAPMAETYDLACVCLDRDFVARCEPEELETRLSDALSGVTGEQAQQLSDALEVLYAGVAGVRVPCESDSLNEVKVLLERRPENPFSVEDLAQRAYVSPYHLIRTFRQRSGLSPHQFQMQNRVRMAQHLLQEGGKIAEVALAAGFCDQSHFDHWFSRIVGMPPSQFVRAQRDLL